MVQAEWRNQKRKLKVLRKILRRKRKRRKKRKRSKRKQKRNQRKRVQMLRTPMIKTQRTRLASTPHWRMRDSPRRRVNIPSPQVRQLLKEINLRILRKKSLQVQSLLQRSLRKGPHQLTCLQSCMIKYSLRIRYK